MSEKILNVDYESEMGQSYVDYSMSVITERALPDVRDGLKPVQRKDTLLTGWSCRLRQATQKMCENSRRYNG